MGIFEGDDETAVDLGRGSELSASVHHDLRLDPLRQAIGALHDETGARVGTIVSRAADKGVIFLIGAGSLALAALAWRSVAGDDAPAAATVAPGGTGCH